MLADMYNASNMSHVFDSVIQVMYISYPAEGIPGKSLEGFFFLSVSPGVGNLPSNWALKVTHL